MEFSTLEILALILISIALIKLIIYGIRPQLWFNIVEKIYIIPELVSAVGVFLSIIVLYFLIDAGISIVEILAVCLFIALLMITGLASYADEVISWAREQDFAFIVKRLWIYTFAWILLIMWGIYALFAGN